MAFDNLPPELAHHLDASDFYVRMERQRKEQIAILKARKRESEISHLSEEPVRILSNGNGVLD
ncbi:hypothetical protein [Brucella inopinata]|uniref:Uncharacterized protein n=1 Tax=Brucella inopinata TaxID=1218315 RepID=A0AAW7BA76_9HYPH|nr:hypothetical protein [Brucella inopinata]KEY05902.1 hypothetical protein IL59_0200775 [Brucella suis bv. 4 str. 40]MDL2332874.1 hypothetical protein [Brucella inopinata]